MILDGQAQQKFTSLRENVRDCVCVCVCVCVGVCVYVSVHEMCFLVLVLTLNHMRCFH